jgi:hypothetical protein
MKRRSMYYIQFLEACLISLSSMLSDERGDMELIEIRDRNGNFQTVTLNEIRAVVRGAAVSDRFPEKWERDWDMEV